MRPTEGSTVASFIEAISARCAEEFRCPPRYIQYGIRLEFKNGSHLLVWFNGYGYISCLELGFSPPPTVVDLIDEFSARIGFAGKARAQWREARARWRQQLASRQSDEDCEAKTNDRLDAIDSVAASSADPLALIPAVGGISVRERTGRTASASSDIAVRGESGWSQEIGRRCEAYAFERIAALFGERCSTVSGEARRVRLSLETGIRWLIWLNADGAQHQSWDIEERDASTGEILRRHEVKARTAELTEAEYALAVQHGDSYMIWRVDPEAGQCDRCAVRARTPMGPATGIARRLIGRVENAIDTDCADGTTLVVLHRSTREYCRELQRQFPSVVGRYRRNLVVCFPMTPDLEKRLPPSKNRVWVANRSRAGCERCADALLQAKGTLRNEHSDGLLVVALLMSTRLGTARAIERLARGPALCLRGN